MSDYTAFDMEQNPCGAADDLASMEKRIAELEARCSVFLERDKKYTKTIAGLYNENDELQAENKGLKESLSVQYSREGTTNFYGRPFQYWFELEDKYEVLREIAKELADDLESSMDAEYYGRFDAMAKWERDMKIILRTRDLLGEQGE
jgi:hypothetical protein